VAEFIATQARFKGMDAEAVGEVQAWVDERWARFVARDAGS
jgi:hypothetical protein